MLWKRMSGKPRICKRNHAKHIENRTAMDFPPRDLQLRLKPDDYGILILPTGNCMWRMSGNVNPRLPSLTLIEPCRV